MEVEFRFKKYNLHESLEKNSHLRVAIRFLVIYNRTRPTSAEGRIQVLSMERNDVTNEADL